MDSNSRFRTWHDKLTNGRCKELEEFLIAKQLFIINEKSEMKTFQSSRGSSNIDLTISNSMLLKKVQEWKTSEEENCSDHKIIQLCIRQYNVQQKGNNFQGIKYVTRGENLGKFEAILTQ
jgi:Holliday junction resolvasome RuvABC ATP-dependent DNA helicase subunit